MTEAVPARADVSHVVKMPVRWGDMDALGHVNNAVYFTYDESARIAYFEPLIRDDPGFWIEHGLILAHIECDFLSQLKPPAEISIGFRIARFGRSSMHSLAAVFLNDKPVAVMRGVIVWFDYRNQKAAALPEHVRQMIREREVIAPSES